MADLLPGIVRCGDCGNTYNKDIHDSCPNCARNFGTPAYKLARNEGPDTSQAAARGVDTTLRERQVYDVILAAGARGMISDEIRRAMRHVTDSYSSVTARYVGLKEKKLIVDLPETRPGDSGRQQHVKVATVFLK